MPHHAAPAPAFTIDDAALAARCIAGDATAWALLVQRYQRLVHAVARRAGLDEHAVADVFQTTFARLIEHLPRLQQPERLQAWLVTTAKREALHMRGLARRNVSMTRADGDTGTAIEDTHADDAPLAEDALAALQELDLMRRCLDELDSRCRDLLLMVFSDEEERLSYEELGRRLNMPVGSIGPTRARCLGKLRTLVDAALKNV